jgi:hypothetical protein
MILVLKKNESHAAMLIKGPEKDKTTSEPSNGQQVKPDIVKRYRKSDKQNNPGKNKEK